MKARFKYRIYPTLGQKQRLARLFGCVRVVWNDSLACCQEKYKLGKKNRLILNYKNSLLLWLKRLRKKMAIRSFCYTTTAIFKQFKPGLSKLF